jgi:methionyl-tRNA formyltransferase
VSARAVVFAYHDVGVRCLSVLLAHGIEIPLVVTHADDPDENVWFASVERLARWHDIEVVRPDDPEQLAGRLARMAPDFLFSFYYRRMLPPSVLSCASRGAYNMHGSLLPKYRGRVPVNWAVLRGERETGATLHEMLAKPDAGRIAGQMAVPILPDDRAIDVFRKVTTAAEIVLDRALPGLLDGSLQLTEQDLGAGSYFRGRKPEDGRIDWSKGAREIHDLVRAVAPPYPGAFTHLGDKRLRVLRTRMLAPRGAPGEASLRVEKGGRLVAQCTDGSRLAILEAELDGLPFTPAHVGTQVLPLADATLARLR